MVKFAMSITSDYRPSWGIYECVRECIQNALDAQDEGHEMTVSHVGETVRISTHGVKLDPRIWLMGMSTKGDSATARGRHGEGLVVSVLAGTRAGSHIRIVNGDQLWIPSIEPSEDFPGEKLLHITTHNRNSDTGAFTVEIPGVSAEMWDDYRRRFLDLTPPKNVIETFRGQILLDADLQGMIFVKGIFVEHDPRLHYGYNLTLGVKVDVERRMVSKEDLRSNAASMWNKAAAKEDGALARLVTMLEDNAGDLDDFVYSVSTEVIDKITERFLLKHGPDAFPVLNVEAAQKVGHYQKVGVILPEIYVRIVQHKLGKIENLLQKFVGAAVRVWQIDELTNAQQHVYRDVVDMVETAAVKYGFTGVEGRLKIVDFNATGLHGLWEAGVLSVARSELDSRQSFVATLIHEMCHDKGGDGAKGHIEAMEDVFSFLIHEFMSLGSRLY